MFVCIHCDGDLPANRKNNCGSDACKKSAALANWRKHTYGITHSEYRALLAKQNNACAACKGELTDAVVDHDHTTGTIRGILCRRCNVALGMVDDDCEKLRALVTYLTDRDARKRRVNVTY